MGPRSSIPPAAALVAAACSLSPVHAASARTGSEIPFAGGWAPNGLAVCTLAGEQTDPVVVPDGSGGAIVAWVDGRTGTGTDLYASRVLADGRLAPGWTQGGTPVCTEIGDPSAVVIAGDGSGGAFLAWLDGRECGPCRRIYVQHLESGGQPAAGWPTGGMAALPDTTPQSVSIASDDAGGLLVAWEEYRGGQGRVYAQRLTAAGVPAAGWPPQGLSLSRPESISDSGPRIVPDGSGGAYADWSDLWLRCSTEYCSSAGAIVLARIADGNVIWRSAYSDAFAQGPYRSLFAEDGTGGCFWGQSRLWGACPNRIGPQGGYLWGTSCFLGVEGFPEIFPERTGGAVLAGVTSGAGGDIAAIRLTALGEVAAGWSSDPATLICGAVGDQTLPVAVADGTGGAYFCWLDQREGRYDIYASRWASGGTRSSGWTLDGNPVARGPGDRRQFRTVADGLDGALIVWSDTRGDAGDIYAQRLTGDAPTAIHVSLARAEAGPDRVRLEWVTPWSNARAELLRLDPGGEWRLLAGLFADGVGRVVFEDRDVVRGSRYAYRLDIVPDGRRYASDVTWIEVPREATFELVGVRPNPSDGDFVVEFALAAGGPAQLELFDPHGRRVATTAVGSAAAGRQLLRFGRPEGLAAGVYLLRLVQGRHALTAKVGVVR